MGTGNEPLIDRAAGIFDDLGYSVSTAGEELRAERRWRTVRVTPVADPGELPTTGEFRCFVADESNVAVLERALVGLEPDYEWAIIGVGEGDGYEVVREPPTDQRAGERRWPAERAP